MLLLSLSDFCSVCLKQVISWYLVYWAGDLCLLMWRSSAMLPARSSNPKYTLLSTKLVNASICMNQLFALRKRGLEKLSFVKFNRLPRIGSQNHCFPPSKNDRSSRLYQSQSQSQSQMYTIFTDRWHVARRRRCLLITIASSFPSMFNFTRMGMKYGATNTPPTDCMISHVIETCDLAWYESVSYI